jgi:UDP-N-acetylglucosamine acyltransferase
MSEPNTIHPTAVIGPGVELGRDNIVSPYAVILGPCRIGDRNWIGPHAVIGTPAQVRDRPHPAGWDAADLAAGIDIGNDNIIREYAAIHLPIETATLIGNGCYLMAYSNVPHDAVIGNAVTLSSAAQLGGHVVVGTGANLGLGAMVHQRRVIGAGAMVGMGAIVTRDVPPFSMAYGNPARVNGVNEIGLRRSGYGQAVIDELSRHLIDQVDLGELPALPSEIRDVLVQYWTTVGSS